MASCITSFNYSLVSQVVFSMAKKIHLLMRGWFFTVDVIMTNSCANTTNSNAKLQNQLQNQLNQLQNQLN